MNDRERTDSSCCPWFLSRRQACTGRTQLCFCASSDTLFPPDLCSAGGSLSRSLGEGKFIETNRIKTSKRSIPSGDMRFDHIKQVDGEKYVYFYFYN